MDRQEGLAIVREMVADSLGLDLDEVSPESRLIDELGADSLDLIDLIFQLDKRFDVNIRQGELAFLARLGSGDDLQDGYLPAGDVAALAPWLPGLREMDPNQVRPGALFSLITVETLWLMLEHTLESS